MEKFDLIDKNRLSLGKTLERGDNNILEGEYRQVVHIAIFNSNNQMLIQQRQPTKKIFPNLWDISVGGSVISGETPCDAASRELLEELGIKIDFSNSRPVLTSNFKTGFDDYFVVNKDIKLEELTLQIEEVKDAKWANLDEILRMIDNKTFIEYNKNFIKLLFDLRTDDCRIIAK